jgi:hypothetical protein
VPDIRVEITSSTLDIAEQWRDLVGRAAANVFLDPIALNTVLEAGFAMLHVLLAWDCSQMPDKLVGVWALQKCKLTPLGPSLLLAPPYRFSFASTPVVDPAFVRKVVPAFLDAVAAAPQLPKLLRVKYLDGESEVSQTLLSELARRGARRRILSTRARAFASPGAATKSSGSTRKKMRQDWNRLSALGAVDVVNDHEAVADALDAFLDLEAKSWKGARGTALLSDPYDARFARRLLTNLAQSKQASVALLRLDGKPIAAQVLLYCGDMAYTWKTAFDETYAKFSPGVLLLDKITEEILGSGVASIESCSPEGGFMENAWTGRRQTIDLLAKVGGRSSFSFALAEMIEAGRVRAKSLRGRMRSMNWVPKRKALLPAARAS